MGKQMKGLRNASGVMWNKTESVAQPLELGHESTSIRNWHKPKQRIIHFHRLREWVSEEHPGYIPSPSVAIPGIGKGYVGWTRSLLTGIGTPVDSE